MQNQQEGAKLAIVKEMILTQINELSSNLANKREGVLETQKEMWREARVVLRDFDDVADLTIFTEDLSRHQQEYADTSRRLNTLKKMLDSPYFARIDFAEEGYEDVEEIYIGRNSLFDDKTGIYQVYDWRAPISSLYYDYGVGKASFFVPATKVLISGKILLKRQYQIEKCELLYLFDNDLAIDDDILRLELSKASDAHIKTIINTIQAEQNRAIRAEDNHVLVCGPAGSGKTSVGLHRLAYLLYRHRNSLTSARVRIFSPSPIFASYIEGIIPELGEEDVLNLDFPTLLEQHTNRTFHSPYHQIESIMKSDESNHENHENDEKNNSYEKTRRNWIVQKYSSKFLDALENAVINYMPSFEDVKFIDNCIVPAKRLEELYQDRTSSSTLSLKTSRVLDFVNQAYAKYFKDNHQSIVSFFDNLHDDTFSDAEIRTKFEHEKSIVIADLKNRLKPSAVRIYKRHLQNWAKISKKEGEYLSIKFAKDALNMEKLYYEDALILFYVNILIGRIQQDRSVKHILLDEAQDLSHLHHRILSRLYTSSHFTVLADVNQALYPEINITDSADLAALYPKAKLIPLTKSYRSTYEISRFATKLLSNVDFKNSSKGNDITTDATFFARHGEEPSIITTSDTVATTIEIISDLPKEYNTVAILFSDSEKASEFYTKLQTLYKLQKIQKEGSLQEIKLITSESEEFSSGVMVMAVPFAKGLEFDAIICPEYGKLISIAEQFSNSKMMRLLYLICTRALHRLYLLQ